MDINKILILILLGFLYQQPIFSSEFVKVENKSSKFFFQSNITESDFELVVMEIGKDLALPEKKPALYFYNSEDELYTDLVDKWGESAGAGEWYRSNLTVPRMNKDFVMWVRPSDDMLNVAHEYTHRIIEQIAGFGSQMNYKWYDEGLAEFEGIKLLSLKDKDKGRRAREAYLKIGMTYYRNGHLRIKDITTGKQWSKHTESFGDKHYKQSYMMMNYLIEKESIKKVRKVLELIGSGTDFENSFKSVFGKSTDSFEAEYLSYMEKQKIDEEKTLQPLAFNFTKDDDEWQKINPLTDDGKDNLAFPRSDIRNIYAEINKGKLYVLFTTESPKDPKAGTIEFSILVDTNSDTHADYQIGFNTETAWLWDLSKHGEDSYKDIRNLMSNIEHEKYFGKTIKFMLPVSLLNNPQTIKINLSSWSNKQVSNAYKKWISVEVIK